MNITRPLVSVLVPVYNVEKYVCEALTSIANQSYRNLQIIVVDDCSTDNTKQIVETFCTKDSRFLLVANEQNLRIVKTLNKALQFAQGEFIARCDGDDVMEVDRIEKQFDYLQKHPEISLVGCSFRAIDEEGNYLRNREYPSGAALLKKLLKYCSPVSHIWLARREVYDKVGNYRMPTVEDYDFLLRADAAGFLIDNIPDYLGMKVRMRTDNTVGRYGIVQRMLFNYAKKIRNFPEKFSDEDVSAIFLKGEGGVLAWLHYISDKASYSASINNNFVGRTFYILIAMIISPYKFQYYKNSLMQKIVAIKFFSR